MTSIEAPYLKFSRFTMLDMSTLQLWLFCLQCKGHCSLSVVISHISIFSVFFYFTENGAHLLYFLLHMSWCSLICFQRFIFFPCSRVENVKFIKQEEIKYTKERSAVTSLMSPMSVRGSDSHCRALITDTQIVDKVNYFVEGWHTWMNI